jgi:methylglyoxal synthase
VTRNINANVFDLRNRGMLHKTIPMAAKKNIALVAHDNKKDELLEWAKFNRKLLAAHSLYSTGTTGSILTSKLGLDVINLQSGPLGGDQQIGSRISEGEINFVIFFWDPLEAQSHDPDVKALLRIAVVWNVPMACNRASADFVISSALMSQTYDRLVPHYVKSRAQPVPRGIERMSRSLHLRNGQSRESASVRRMAGRPRHPKTRTAELGALYSPPSTVQPPV